MEKKIKITVVYFLYSKCFKKSVSDIEELNPIHGSHEMLLAALKSNALSKEDLAELFGLSNHKVEEDKTTIQPTTNSPQTPLHGLGGLSPEELQTYSKVETLLGKIRQSQEQSSDNLWNNGHSPRQEILTYTAQPSMNVPHNSYPLYPQQVQVYPKPIATRNYAHQPNRQVIRDLPYISNNRQSHPNLQQKNYQNLPRLNIQQAMQNPNTLTPRFSNSFQKQQLPGTVAGPQNKYIFEGPLSEPTPIPTLKPTTTNPETLSEEEVAAYLRIQSLLKKFDKD
jgi:hypothetical protein